MKFCFSFLLLFFTVQIFAQDTINQRVHRKTYLILSEYKKLGKPLTRQDTLNFKFFKGDTLVLINEELAPSLADNQVRVPYEFKSSNFLEKYKEVVFTNENSTIKIWKDDVKIFFDPTVPNKHRKALMDFAAGLSKSVDSINIIEVTNREDSNYLIYYINSNKDSIYEKRIKSPHAGYYVNWNRKHQLQKASLQLNTTTIRTDHYQISHLKYQFFRSMGFFQGSDKVDCAGYLANCSSLRNLTNIDMELLKYHYSYGMCKGISQENFERIHRQMKETLEFDPTAKVYVIHML